MTRDPRDYKVEISGISSSDSAASASQRTPSPRPFLSIHFACCGVYQRIYRTEDGKAYSGHCPRCAKPVHFAIGANGTDTRYFRVE